MPSIPNVHEHDIDIPAGKVAIKDPRQMTDHDRRTKTEIIDSKMRWGKVKTDLVARHAGWSVAGSMMRWDNGAFGVIWKDSNGSQHGSWFKTFEDALAKFESVPIIDPYEAYTK